MSVLAAVTVSFLIGMTPYGGDTDVIEQRDINSMEECLFHMGGRAIAANREGEVGEVITALHKDKDGDWMFQFTYAPDETILITLACVDYPFT
jgi:hypothetical protein